MIWISRYAQSGGGKEADILTDRLTEADRQEKAGRVADRETDSGQTNRKRLGGRQAMEGATQL